MPEPPMIPSTALVIVGRSNRLTAVALEHTGKVDEDAPGSCSHGLPDPAPLPNLRREAEARRRAGLRNRLHALGYSTGARPRSSSGCNATRCHTFFLVK